MDEYHSFLVWGARESRRARADDMGRGRHLRRTVSSERPQDGGEARLLQAVNEWRARRPS